MEQTTIVMEDMLNSIKDQTDGFRFGEVWRISNKALGALIPILRHKDAKRAYLMIEELKKGQYEILDSGSIDKIRIKGSFDKAVFIRTGNIFEGKGTQSRAAEISIIILPSKTKEETIIPARCVHASHPISSGAKFERFGYAPREVTYNLFTRRGQGEVWASVGGSSARLFSMADPQLRRMAASDSMVSNLRQVKEDKSKITSILKNIPCLENQVGIVIIDEKGVSHIEVFNHPDSWSAFHESIIENYSDILTKEQDEPLFEIKKEAVPKKIGEFIEKLKNTEKKPVFKNKRATTFILSNNSIVGECSTLDNEIIHILASRTLSTTSETKSRESQLFGEHHIYSERMNNLVYGTRARENNPHILSK